jgi:long-chain acyl-CoA synthetase
MAAEFDHSSLIQQMTGPGSTFEIGSAEVGDRTVRTWLHAPPTLRDLLEGTRRHGDREYLVYGDERWTFAEHLRLVAAAARWLQDEAGLRTGDRVAIGMRNYPEWVMAFWATQAIGTVAVPLNAWWTAPELRFALEDSGATLAVVDDERHERMAPDLDELGITTVVARHDGALGGEVRPWADVVAGAHEDATLPLVAVDPDDDATIVYTSGTTGRPKGAVASHRNHVSTLFNTAFAGALDVALAGKRPKDPDGKPSFPPCALMTYQFFHIGGLNAMYINTGFGVKSVLQFKWDLEEALAIVERERVTRIAAVPTLLRQLLESPLLERYDLSSLTVFASGGAPVPPDLVSRIETKGASASNGYGLTETTGAVTVNMGDEYVGHASSVGKPFPVTGVRVVDPASLEDLPPGEVGELSFGGPTVCRGYWNRPDATAASFTDGWFHTGDLGFVDEDGFVSVVDRLKDVIIRGGENVYCAEVEARLFEHPAVADVAVVGVADASLGEEVAAVVRLRDGAESSTSPGSARQELAKRGHPISSPSTTTACGLDRFCRDERVIRLSLSARLTLLTASTTTEPVPPDGNGFLRSSVVEQGQCLRVMHRHRLVRRARRSGRTRHRGR